MKQTAVEWLVSKLPQRMLNYLKEEIEQAREMERQQIIDAQSYAISKADITNNRGYFDCEKYYNETFNK